MENKPSWQSKTVWLAVISALAPLFPSVHSWIVSNPEMYASVLSGLFLVLRFLSNGKISIM